MTAEEKLREWYREVRKYDVPYQKEVASIAPEHIDLIANLIIERMKNETTSHS